ncbi:MAG TPA: M13 family metallopeptidase [Thermoplasmata archaeon]|nr:M13 family metallopeptidase [Thermoplasmata archaeon]
MNPTGRASERPAPDPGFSVRFMDAATPASQDFYRHATGTWLRENPVPADKARWGAFDELLERNFRLIHELLEDAATHAEDAADSPRRQVGVLYRSALDQERRERLRYEPIAPALARVGELRSVEELSAVLAEFHREGLGGPFESYVYPDKRASEVYAFYVVQGGLSLPDREYYLEPAFESVRSAYRSHVQGAFEALGEPPERAGATTDAIVQLETELARASRSRTELRDEEKNYHRTTVGELAGREANVPWRAYLAGRELGALPHLVVGQPEFLDAVDRLLVERKLPAWRAYLRWTLLRSSSPFLHDAAEQASFAFFHRTLRGQQEPEPPWKRAALVVDACLGEALGELYVRRAFPPEARARMGVLIDDLRLVFRDRLARLDWMSEPTRERALAKFARFTAKIGHPDRFRDYSSIRLAADDYLGNVRRCHAFEVHRMVVQVGGPIDRSEWGMTPPTVNAYFSPVRNEIVFPAGILQPPFFDAAMDDAVNYGGIGAVIGHEITHGYDDQGRKYDAEGNLADWWTEADAREFQRRAAQVVRQYDGYEPLPGLRVNGQLTLGENLADLGGLSIAFEALQRRLAAEPARRRTVDGKTAEQRFFLSWAQVWRQNCSEEELRRRIVTDPHSPGAFRARGAAVQMDAFFDAFAIPEGSPMWRPRPERVAIW